MKKLLLNNEGYKELTGTELPAHQLNRVLEKLERLVYIMSNCHQTDLSEEGGHRKKWKTIKVEPNFLTWDHRVCGQTVVFSG